MNSVYIGLIILVVLVVVGIFSIVKFFSWLGKRYYRNMFRGHLREDYLRKNPNLARNGHITCACGSKKIVLRNLPMSSAGSNVIREHVCHNCGNRLFFSASGSYLEGIIRELRKEAGHAEPLLMHDGVHNPKYQA